MHVKQHCSPIESNNKYSCLDDDIIIDIANILNNNNENININIKNNPEKIHKDIEKILKKWNINEEKSIQNIKQIKDNLSSDKLKRFNESFKPAMPKEWYNNINTWLCTTDITNVLNQYKKNNKDFYLYGPTPIDFDLKNNNNECLVDSLCKFNLSNHIKNNQTKIGIIFNTDPHTESGEHWISMYIDVNGINLNNKPGIYFFDSTGEDPPEEIIKLINKVIEQGEKENINFVYFENDIQHQKGGTECGMYSLHFIINMLNGTNFKKYVKEYKNDKFMEKFRKIYFIE